ncbi:MAG TPA: hypothetical protein VG797_00670, partial [Phycisphaerales bacterium]|nr:hypothetical protein [Phycisphaerales bacterium]
VPGAVLGPNALGAGGAFSFPGVTANLFGSLTYNATGLVCTALQGSGLPCSATRDLSENNPVTFDNVAGTVTSASRVVTLVSNIDQTTPLDPSNPSLGTVRIFGTIRGSVSVPVPCAGDANSDGAVGLADIAVIIQGWGNTGFPRISGDLSEDGAVGLPDIAQVIQNWGHTCP